MAARITSRDFKRSRSNGLRLDLHRWREFGAGLAAGLSLSVGVLVWQNYHEKTNTIAAAEKPTPEKHPDKAVNPGEADESAKSYDFYDMLPNFEVVVPEKDKEVSVSRDRNAAPAAITRPGQYVLQAGSYRKEEEADRIAAQLKKLGIDSTVQRVAVDDDVWHRVRIGPINDLTELNRLRARLRSAEFNEALVIRVGD